MKKFFILVALLISGLEIQGQQARPNFYCPLNLCCPLSVHPYNGMPLERLSDRTTVCRCTIKHSGGDNFTLRCDVTQCMGSFKFAANGSPLSSTAVMPATGVCTIHSRDMSTVLHAHIMASNPWVPVKIANRNDLYGTFDTSRMRFGLWNQDQPLLFTPYQKQP